MMRRPYRKVLHRSDPPNATPTKPDDTDHGKIHEGMVEQPKQESVPTGFRPKKKSSQQSLR